jgi:hypothetical protein
MLNAAVVLKHMRKAIAESSAVSKYLGALAVRVVFVKDAFTKLIQLLGAALHLVVAARRQKKGLGLILSNLRNDGIDGGRDNVVRDALFEHSLFGCWLATRKARERHRSKDCRKAGLTAAFAACGQTECAAEIQ